MSNLKDQMMNEARAGRDPAQPAINQGNDWHWAQHEAKQIKEQVNREREWRASLESPVGDGSSAEGGGAIIGFLVVMAIGIALLDVLLTGFFAALIVLSFAVALKRENAVRFLAANIVIFGSVLGLFLTIDAVAATPPAVLQFIYDRPAFGADAGLASRVSAAFFLCLIVSILPWTPTYVAPLLLGWPARAAANWNHTTNGGARRRIVLICFAVVLAIMLGWIAFWWPYLSQHWINYVIVLYVTAHCLLILRYIQLFAPYDPREPNSFFALMRGM